MIDIEFKGGLIGILVAITYSLLISVRTVLGGIVTNQSFIQILLTDGVIGLAIGMAIWNLLDINKSIKAFLVGSLTPLAYNAYFVFVEGGVVRAIELVILENILLGGIIGVGMLGIISLIEKRL